MRSPGVYSMRGAWWRVRSARQPVCGCRAKGGGRRVDITASAAPARIAWMAPPLALGVDDVLCELAVASDESAATGPGSRYGRRLPRVACVADGPGADAARHVLK